MRRDSRRSTSDEFRDVSRSECRAEQISVAAATTASARRGHEWTLHFRESRPSIGRRAIVCWSRRSSCVARWKRSPRPGARSRPAEPFARTTSSREPARTARPSTSGFRSCSRRARTRLSSTASCSRAIPVTTGRGRRAARPRSSHAPTARAPRASPFSTSSTASLSTRASTSTSVAKAPLARILTFAEERGWQRLRLLSSAANTYNRDYLAETAEGAQRPMLTVFHRDGDAIRHFWSSELFYAPSDPGQEPRHVGTLEPLWNLLDLTPEGRPTAWDEQLSYT